MGGILAGRKTPERATPSIATTVITREDREGQATFELRNRKGHQIDLSVANAKAIVQKALNMGGLLALGYGAFPVTSLTIDNPVAVRGEGKDTILDGDITANQLTILENLKLNGSISGSYSLVNVWDSGDQFKGIEMNASSDNPLIKLVQGGKGTVLWLQKAEASQLYFLRSEDSGGSLLAQTPYSRIFLFGNCYYDGANFMRFNTSYPAWGLGLIPDVDVLRVYRAPAGGNPATLSTLFELSNTGAITCYNSITLPNFAAFQTRDSTGTIRKLLQADSADIIHFPYDYNGDIHCWYSGAIGTGRAFSLDGTDSNAVNTLRDSPSLVLKALYYDGVSNIPRLAVLKHLMNTTTPKSTLQFSIADSAILELTNDGGTLSEKVYGNLDANTQAVLVRIRTDIADYGGAFAAYTPPTGEEGALVLAEDTNAVTPGRRLYAYINGTWRYVDLT